VLLSVREEKEAGEKDRNGKLQTLEKEGEAEDKLASPPPHLSPSLCLSQDYCVRDCR